jgi:hypothetical protein
MSLLFSPRLFDGWNKVRLLQSCEGRLTGKMELHHISHCLHLTKIVPGAENSSGDDQVPGQTRSTEQGLGAPFMFYMLVGARL